MSSHVKKNCSFIVMLFYSDGLASETIPVYPFSCASYNQIKRFWQRNKIYLSLIHNRNFVSSNLFGSRLLSVTQHVQWVACFLKYVYKHSDKGTIPFPAKSTKPYFF